MHIKSADSILTHFFSNLDKQVFVLKNMPEILKGALFSRYSRSSKPLRQLFLEDYINEETLNLGSKIKNLAAIEDVNSLLLTEKAQGFYRKWLAMYGDDSIAELGGIHIAIENISVVATKAIEDRRIGISPLEISTRYVQFNDKVKGKYRYYRDKELIKSKYGNSYLKTMDFMFDTYAKLLEPMKVHFTKKYPKPADISDNAYTTSIKAKAYDTLRGLLPMGTLANMGIFANGRAVEYLLTKMYAHPLEEVQKLAKLIHNEVKPFIGNFVERLDSEKGAKYIEYLKTVDKDVKELAINVPAVKVNKRKVTLIDYENDAEIKAAASILFPYSTESYEKILKTVKKLSSKKLAHIIDTYVCRRQGRWHKVGKGFEEIYYTFEIVSDNGAYKDLERHRICSQYRQLFTTELGYEVPKAICEAGFETDYRRAMNLADKTYSKLKKQFPDQAQYVAGHGHLLRWRIKMNLREAFHLCELRSSPQGHPNYRQIAQEIYKLIKQVHPILGESMKFVNMDDPGLERLSAEVRKEEKLKFLGVKQK